MTLNKMSFQVPLSGQLDRAPELQLVTPVSGDILEGETQFEALVSDDIDPTEYLMVQWQSNQDGLFSTGEAFADGTVSTLWNEYHSSGYHNIEVSVVDSCNNITQETVSVCQQLTYDVNALDVNTWNFEGNASWDATNNWVELTSAQRWQSGDRILRKVKKSLLVGLILNLSSISVMVAERMGCL